MELKEILAIAGHSGLFKFISQGRNGIIVEGVESKKRMNAFAHYKVSSLSDIAIYADSGEVPLRKIFKTIQELEKSGDVLDAKANDTKIKEFFGKILPDYDKDRVYVSDIKKIFTWYTILNRNGINNFEEEIEETTENTETAKE